MPVRDLSIAGFAALASLGPQFFVSERFDKFERPFFNIALGDDGSVSDFTVSSPSGAPSDQTVEWLLGKFTGFDKVCILGPMWRGLVLLAASPRLLGLVVLNGGVLGLADGGLRIGLVDGGLCTGVWACMSTITEGQ
jgi:hypothetical protein